MCSERKKKTLPGKKTKKTKLVLTIVISAILWLVFHGEDLPDFTRGRKGDGVQGLEGLPSESLSDD